MVSFRLPLIIAFAFVFGRLAAQDHLITSERVAHWSAAQLDSMFSKIPAPKVFLQVKNGVDIYDIDYATEWHDRTVIKASGLVFVPVSESLEPAPLAAIHHGTNIYRRKEFKFSGSETLAAIMAADGYAVILPDYIGLGRGDMFHLYHHVQTEAMGTLDMIRATRELFASLSVPLNGDIYLTGYSQGGHATLAVQKVAQEQYADEFKVVATAPLSGAYDLDGVQGKVMGKSYDYPAYLPYLLIAMAEVKGLHPIPAQMFVHPFDTVVPWLYDGDHKMRDLSPLLPAIPREMVREELLKAFDQDPQFPIREAIRENSLDAWKPEAPVLMCFCDADEQVNYQNAIVAQKQMRELGAEMVKKKRVARKFGHNDCAPFAYMYAKMWFDGYRHHRHEGSLGPFGKRFLVRMGVLFSPSTKAKMKKREKAREKAAKDNG